jgi:hypothetical protein
VPEVADLAVAWRSPTYYHCNFTFVSGHCAPGLTCDARLPARRVPVT